MKDKKENEKKAKVEMEGDLMKIGVCRRSKMVKNRREWKTVVNEGKVYRDCSKIEVK